jgi:hypothetical protein
LRDYPNNGDGFGRMQMFYKRVRHSCSPTTFSELTISGSVGEMGDWLGANDLPLRYVSGQQCIREPRIETAQGVVAIG